MTNATENPSVEPRRALKFRIITILTSLVIVIVLAIVFGQTQIKAIPDEDYAAMWEKEVKVRDSKLKELELLNLELDIHNRNLKNIETQAEIARKRDEGVKKNTQ